MSAVMGWAAAAVASGLLRIGHDAYPAEGSPPQNAFVLRRAEAGLESAPAARLLWGLRAEAVEAAGPDSGVGLDGDSWVLRVGQASIGIGGEDLGLRWAVRAGMLPDAWLRTAEALAPERDLRDLAPSLGEQFHLFPRADLGMDGTASALEGRVGLTVAVVNGEGHNRRESNPGKNATGCLFAEPYRGRLWSGPAAIRAAVGMRDGSVGLLGAADRRWAAGAAFESEPLALGLEHVGAFGLDGQSRRRADADLVWVNVRAYPAWLGVALRADRFRPSTETHPSGVGDAGLLGALTGTLPPAPGDDDQLRARIALGVERRFAEGDVAAIPGLADGRPAWRTFLTLSLSTRTALGRGSP